MTGNVAPDPTESAREELLRQLLDAAGRGTLPPDEYAAQVQAVQGARSVADMVAIVTAPVPGASGKASSPVASRSPTPVAPSTPAAEPVLDPVDLARMMAPPPKARRRSERSRYTALIAMVVVFFLLVVAGLLMATHVHAGGGTVGGPAAPAAALAAAGP